SDSMYDGRLMPAPEVADHRLEDLGAADRFGGAVCVFLDTAGKGWSEERDDDQSYFNRLQSERVIDEARALEKSGLPWSKIAIIAGYRAEVRLLRASLGAELAAGLEVATVDAFQGREKEAVIVDLVRSNDDGEVGFLADTRRMNVALTRARRFLLVVGDSATLAAHPYYRAFQAKIEEQGGYRSAWSI
ncbi:MAG: C-terminal helicase domain-containing protein, partial [Deltaproteobacteria bacterium]|nr:C-terminal helicase domain-containing protein [Deltaproteobacteria bacterium]